MSLEPPVIPTTRRIKRFAPLQLGKVMGLTYGVLGLFFCPIFLLMALLSHAMPPQQRVGMMAFGTGFAIAMPFLYGAMGFIFGVIGAFIYNLIAKWVGGIEVEVE
jgi:hypothetical protein